VLSVAWGSFQAVIFLGSGIYLLQESFTDPRRAQAVGLVAGAFIIALATILIYFIFTPRKRFETEKSRRPQTHSPVVCASPLAPAKKTAKSLASTIANADRTALIDHALGIAAK
jgi:hypothetical protein